MTSSLQDCHTRPSEESREQAGGASWIHGRKTGRADKGCNNVSYIIKPGWVKKGSLLGGGGGETMRTPSKKVIKKIINISFRLYVLTCVFW